MEKNNIIMEQATTHSVLVDTVDHGEHAVTGSHQSKHGGMKGDTVVCVCPSVSQPTVSAFVVIDDDKMVVTNEVRACVGSQR